MISQSSWWNPFSMFSNSVGWTLVGKIEIKLSSFWFTATLLHTCQSKVFLANMERGVQDQLSESRIYRKPGGWINHSKTRIWSDEPISSEYWADKFPSNSKCWGRGGWTGKFQCSHGVSWSFRVCRGCGVIWYEFRWCFSREHSRLPKFGQKKVWTKTRSSNCLLVKTMKEKGKKKG